MNGVWVVCVDGVWVVRQWVGGLYEWCVGGPSVDGL